MAEQQNPSPYGHIQTPGPPQATSNVPGYGYGNQNQGQRPPVPGNVQWKSGPPMHNGPMTGQGPQGQSPGVNGFSTPPVSQGSSQFSGPRPPMSGQNFMNGPYARPQFPNSNQFQPPQRPVMPTGQGQFRPPVSQQQLSGNRPPGSGPPFVSQNSGPPIGSGGMQRMPPPSSVQQGLPPPTMTTQGMGPPPKLSEPNQPSLPQMSAQGRPNELPVPFHGQGQYDHQVGMALTPGITPANSGPPSQKSSRTSSPAVMGQNFDALEGQFTGTPNTGIQTSPQTQWRQPGPQPAFQQPGLSSPPTTSQQGTRVNQAGPQQFSSIPSSQNSRFPSQSQGEPNQQLGFPPNPVPMQRPGFPPAPVSSAIQSSGFQPISTPSQRPGFPPPPMSVNQQPGYHPQPISTNQMPGFSMPPTSSNQQPFIPPPALSNPTGPFQKQPGFGTPMSGQGQQPGMNSGPPQVQGRSIGQFVNSYPTPNAGINSMSSNFSNMSMQSSHLNLLQEKRLIPPGGVEIPKPVIPNDTKNVNCNPEVFRCTLNAIPQTSALLNKARLPLGILIHPFKDLSQLPVIQSSVIVRCRSCRTYINPFVYFVDNRRWKCNLCYRVNELPDEFSFDPVTKTYGDPQRRPEVRSATIEFIAPSEYMLRPPQPAVYLYLIDVSFNAIETGYLNQFCETLLDVLDKIPGDSRTHIGFIAYDSAVHFFNLAEGLSQPQMLTVSDVDDIFLPSPDDLLVNLNESKNLVRDLLTQLPALFQGNMETRSALGATLQAAFKMTSSTGGRITVMQTILPTYGPGALQNREDSTVKAAKEVPNLGPATDFYKKLALDCSAQQVAVDLFMFNAQYADLASIECISKYSGGSVYYYPSYHSVKTPHLCEKFEADLRRYLTRKIGFESVMRIRCSKGLSIHTFHGNFFVRSTDLLSLPNINPDAGFGMQMSIEESLTDMSTMCFQAALLYTSSKGERRIRVHTLCLPVTNQLSEIHAAADQQAIVSLLAKMAVDRTISSSMSDAREAIVNAVIDTLNSYGGSLQSGQRINSLCINEQLRLVPLFCLALLKSVAFRTGVSTKLDDRAFALQQCKTLPTSQLMQFLHPNLYAVHTIMEVGLVKKSNTEIPDLQLLQLSSAHIDRHGAYLLDTGDTIYLYMGSAISDQFCQDILDVPNFSVVQEDGMIDLPEMENEGSERLRCFITYLLDNRPNGAAFFVVREDGRLRMQFFQHFVEDRTESSMSYYEFLQHIQKQVKS